MRDLPGGIDWVETLLGGKVVATQAQERWRPQYFLDVDIPGEGIRKFVLRGFRNPGYAMPDEATSRGALQIDAEMLAALQDLPVKAPRYYGHNQALGWMLMEFIEGESEFASIASQDERASIYREYLDDLAIIHSQPLDKMRIPALLPVPKDFVAFRKSIEEQAAARLLKPRRYAEPTYMLAYRWGMDNPIANRPLRLCLVDTGPDQFMFGGGRYRGLLDYEYAMVTDPLMETAVMRCRVLSYPVENLAGHIKYYGEKYKSLTGEPLDESAIHYWSIFGVLWLALSFNDAMQALSPKLLDAVFLVSFEMHCRRFLPDAIADRYGIALETPLPPIQRPNTMSPLHQLMTGQLEEHFSGLSRNKDDEQYLKYSRVLAETLRRNNEIGAELHRDNLEELGDVLGRRPQSIELGLHELEAAISSDYEKDLEKRLGFLHRMAMRQEYMYEPMRAACGHSSGFPVSRLNSQHPA